MGGGGDAGFLVTGGMDEGDEDEGGDVGDETLICAEAVRLYIRRLGVAMSNIRKIVYPSL